MIAVEGGVDAVDQFVGGEQAGRFGDAPFAVDPLGLIAPNLMHVCSGGRRKGDG